MENIKETFKQLKEELGSYSGQVSELRENLARVQEEASKAQAVGQEIQTKLNEFNVVAEPKIAKMNEILAKYQTVEDK
ncbi:hypothetical protein [Lactococcus termiticola]|uniref:Uncharacterized protein n=1 Tax=Lactococcus termiticola TaxID=2169526 RepID=A0A2R5HI87_9LACT|nr:hypothetical protein [Lactococcus termiticola]GBG95990.1 hypothetical protein NtB2_00092 [Lactococcus termiticola]